MLGFTLEAIVSVFISSIVLTGTTVSLVRGLKLTGVNNSFLEHRETQSWSCTQQDVQALSIVCSSPGLAATHIIGNDQ